jgi:hypothetical protein
MQPRTPPRQITRFINGHGALAIPVSYSDYSKQFDGQLSFPATDARPHRSDKVVGGASMLRNRTLALNHS